MTPERIEGEHHYAEDGFLWAIKRKSDDELLEMGGGKMWAEDRVKHHDEQANHFIAQGLERVDRAAEEMSPIGRQTTIEQFKDGWQVYNPDRSAATFTQAILSTGAKDE